IYTKYYENYEENFNLKKSQQYQHINIEVKNYFNNCLSDINDEFNIYIQNYNEISKIYAIEEEKLKYFLTNYFIDFDVLMKMVVSPSTDLNIITSYKTQIIVRIFIFIKFFQFLSNSNYIQEIISLLRKLSLLKMPY
ncbi:hypothetical protein MXB_2479, partial [Myxobolus squamalis]